MTIEKINFSYPSGTLQSVFDGDAKTALELAAYNSAKVDECVDVVNGVGQTAIEASAIVDEMKNAQDTFITENSDIRANLIADNQTYLDSLTLSKTTFENDMSTSLTDFETSLNTSKSTFEATMNNEVNSIIENSESLINTDVNTIINGLISDGTISTILNNELLTDINTDLTKVKNNIKDLFINVKDYGAIGDSITDDTQAFKNALLDLSNGGILYIPKTTNYYLLTDEIVITDNIYLIGNKSKIYFKIDGSKNSVRIQGNNIQIKDIDIFTNLQTSVLNVDCGSNIVIGHYASLTEETYNNIIFMNVNLTREGTYSTSVQAIVVYNGCHDIDIKNMIIKGGSTGIVAHWGGDIDINNQDTSPATFTCHPHNINVENIIIDSPSLGLSFSSCYNISVKNVMCLNSTNAIYIIPGDFGNELSVPTQKDLIGCNQRFSNITIINCKSKAITITSTGARAGIYGAIEKGSIILENFTIIKGIDTPASVVPVVIAQAYNVFIKNMNLKNYTTQDGLSLTFCKNIKIENSIINAQRCIVMTSCENISILTTRLIGNNTDGSVGIKTDGSNPTSIITTNLLIGDTVLNVSPTTEYLLSGDKIFFDDGSFVIVSDKWVAKGDTQINIEASSTEKNISDNISYYKYSINIIIDKCYFTKHVYGVWIEDYSYSTAINNSLFELNRRHDIIINGIGSKDVTILSNKFIYGNTTNYANCSAINSNNLNGLIVVGNIFGELNSKNKFCINLLSNVSNALIHDNICYGLLTGGVMFYVTTQTTEALALGKHLIYANRGLNGVSIISGTGYTTFTEVEV